MTRNYIISCFKNNKLVLTVEVNMTQERFEEQVAKGVIHYVSVKGEEYVYLSSFDNITISGDIFIGD